jgi:hypothetical protein
MQPAQIALGQRQLHTEGQVAVVEERNACTRTLLEAPIASKLIVLAALASRAMDPRNG